MKRFNFLMGFLALCFICLLASCAAEQFEPENRTVTPVSDLQITDYQGGSTATHSYNGGNLYVQIILAEKAIYLDDKTKLGQADRVSGTTLDTLIFVDSQKAWVKITYDKNVYDWVKVDFLKYDPLTEGLVATITHQWSVTFGLVGQQGTYGSSPENDKYCRPWYIQTASDDDEVVINKTDTTFTVTTTISGSSVIGRSTVKYPTVEVDKAKIGKLTLTNESQSVSNLDDGFMMTVTDKFGDGQIGNNTAICRHDADAKAWVEVTDIKYVTYYSTPGDGEATIKLKEMYTLEGRGKLAGKSWEIDLYPSYRQVAKTTLDEILLTITNGGLTGKAVAKASISDAEATATINLKKDNIQVDPGVIGTKPSFTVSSALQLSDYSSGGKTGKKGSQKWTGSDTQVAEAVVQWLYATAAENHEEISVGNPTVTVSVTVAGKSDKVTLTFPVTVSQKGELPKTKSGNVIVTYTRQAKADVWTWDKTSNPVMEGKSLVQYTKYNVYKNGTLYASQTFTTAVCGSLNDLTEVFVQNTDVHKNDQERDDTDPDWTTPIRRGNQTTGLWVFTPSSTINQYHRSFTSDAGTQDVYAIKGEYRLQGGSLTFTIDGFTFTDVTTTSKEITIDKLEKDSGVPSTKTSGNHVYTYGGTYKFTVNNYVDGKMYKANSCLTKVWVW